MKTHFLRLSTLALLLLPTFALAQPVASAPTTQAQVAPDANALINQVRDAYSQLKSLQLAGTVSADLDIAGRKQNDQKQFTATYQAPNQFRHEMKDELLIGSTGQKVYAFQSKEKVYLSADAPKTKVTGKELLQPVSQVLEMQNPSLKFAIVKDAGQEIRQGIAQINKVADTQLDNTAYPTLELLTADGRKITLLIDPKTHLLRQARFDLSKALASRGAKDVKIALVTVDYTTSAPNVPLNTDQFAWAPPEGAKDIAEMQRARAQQTPVAGLEGKPAPDFTLNNLDDKPVSLADQKGSVVVLDFWATWCPPCVASLPELDKVYQDLKGQGLKVFALNLQEDKAKVEAFLTDKKITLPVLLDIKGEAAQKYNVQAIPQTVIIDKTGTIRKIFVGIPEGGEAQIRREIEALLK